MRALVVCAFLVASALGCAQVQDLGDSPALVHAPDADGLQTADGALVGASDSAPLPPKLVDPCPDAPPADRSECNVNVAWCAYAIPGPARLPPDQLALASRCSCGVDHRWACVLVRATSSTYPKQALPLTNAACLEGAACAPDVRCSVPRVRTCRCTSAGRFLCSKPAE